VVRPGLRRLHGPARGRQALPFPYNTLASALCTVALAIAYRGWVRATGVSVLGFTPKRARWVAFALGLALLVIILTALALKVRAGLWWAPLAGAPVAAAAAYFASRRWMEVYRRELREAA